MMNDPKDVFLVLGGSINKLKLRLRIHIGLTKGTLVDFSSGCLGQFGEELYEFRLLI